MPSSQILIKDLKFYGFHGVYPEEQIVGTTFKADVTIDIDPTLAGFHSDILNDTLNYERIVEKLLQIGTKQKFRLIEHLAQVMCEAVLEFPHVLAVDVTVYKSVARLTPDPQWVGVRRCIDKTTSV